MSIENAASAMCQMAALPDFQSTPASIKAMENLLLASRCRMALAKSDLTYNTALKVQANDGVMAVTYLPQSAKVANLIPGVLQEVKGVREIVCTMARTNILWIQERFDPASPYFSSICAVADKWDAAVELLRIRPQPEKEQEGRSEKTEQAGEQDTGGIRETLAELIKRGRAGGARSVGRRKLEVLGAIDRSVPYSLIVVGDVFLSKGHVARMRLARELSSFLFDQLKRPVVMAEELASRYLFGPRQWLNLFLFLVVSGALYLGVFSFQEEVLLFLQAEGTRARALAVTAVLLFVPAIAFCYGSSARLVLKLIKME